MAVIKFYVRVDRCHLSTFLLLLNCCISPAVPPPLEIHTTALYYVVCAECHLSLRGPPDWCEGMGPSLAFEYVLGGRGILAVVSTPQHIVFNL